jgi:hypothetical protein
MQCCMVELVDVRVEKQKKGGENKNIETTVDLEIDGCWY